MIEILPQLSAHTRRRRLTRLGLCGMLRAAQRRVLPPREGFVVRLVANTVQRALMVLFLLGLAASAQAQSKKKIIRLEAIKVEGRIQKPQAFYILQRSNLNFEGLELKQSFIPQILKSVEEQPF